MPAIRPKPTWHAPKDDACLNVFLSQLEKELFKIKFSDLRYSNIPTEEWQAVRSLTDDRIIVIKKADIGICVVLWDRNDYLVKPQKQLSDTKV